MTSTQSTETKIIKANYALQAKVGLGPLDLEVVRKCQAVMDSNQVDFAPMAEQLLIKLKRTIDKLAKKELNIHQGTAEMRATVMELKANAGTFGYPLIGNLANIMLSFLEAIRVIDNDVIDIVDAHHKTLSIIVSKRMKGTGGEHGKLFETELKSACKRYFDSIKNKA